MSVLKKFSKVQMESGPKVSPNMAYNFYNKIYFFCTFLHTFCKLFVQVLQTFLNIFGSFYFRIKFLHLKNLNGLLGSFEAEQLRHMTRGRRTILFANTFRCSSVRCSPKKAQLVVLRPLHMTMHWMRWRNPGSNYTPISTSKPFVQFTILSSSGLYTLHFFGNSFFWKKCKRSN